MPATQCARLERGGLIDRSQPLSFQFDHRSFDGYAGDTLASALIANGVRLIGRSFKYHRPRGILSAGSEEPNALVELRGGARREPNTRATTVELFDGLTARSQNRWPSLQFDLGALNQLFAPLLPAGFYYKTSMWPAAFWERVYEPLIRRAAGLGHASVAADPDSYEKSHAFCDVLVIGAGPSGLMAALTAARSGARVILADEDFRCGGRCLAERRTIGAAPAHAWAAGIAGELASMPNVRLMLRTTVFGCYDHGVFGALERVNDHLLVPPEFEPRQRLWRLVARRCVVATGAIEQPLVFANNDRPGVMLAGAVRMYANRYAALAGRRLLVFTCCDDGWTTARDLAAAGATVVAIVDPREILEANVRAIAPRSTEIVTGVVRRVIGHHEVRAAEVRTSGGVSRRIACDLVAMSGGWLPTVQLTAHLGSRPVWGNAVAGFIAGALPDGMAVAGAASGAFNTHSAILSGTSAGAAACKAVGRRAATARLPEVEGEPDTQRPLWKMRAPKGWCFVDFQNDVTTSDVELAGREGLSVVEHLKRYTTLGMASDQGKTSNLNGLAILGEITGRSPSAIGGTTFRPPYVPIAIGALAGHHRGREFRPTRLSPAHHWAIELGAVFVEAGLWLRASYFPRSGETDWLQTVTREVLTVRAAVGVCDISTLGKVDLQGQDAVEFLERLYVNTWRTLAVGRARYGVMLRDDGIVMDDGTVARLGEHHYLITTTTANAALVYQHMQFCHQVLWPQFDVQLASVTEQWAQFAIAGPKARELLRNIVSPEYDLSNDQCPYLAAQEVTLLDGTCARLFRVSFSGELAYELAVPARVGEHVARNLMAAGRPLGVTAYGTESLGVMRIEKGHVAGNELNGHTTAGDLGLGRMVSQRNDFVGAAMARRRALTDSTRPCLIGVRSIDRAARVVAGAHFVPERAAAVAANDQGFISSVAFSPTLGQWIGLGFLVNGRGRLGERLLACDPLRGNEVVVEVCEPVFVDPAGERLRV